MRKEAGARSREDDARVASSTFHFWDDNLLARVKFQWPAWDVESPDGDIIQDFFLILHLYSATSKLVLRRWAFETMPFFLKKTNEGMSSLIKPQDSLPVGWFDHRQLENVSVLQQPKPERLAHHKMLIGRVIVAWPLSFSVANIYPTTHPQIQITRSHQNNPSYHTSHPLVYLRCQFIYQGW